MRASVIAVGTEITSGEVVNKNSSWIANELEKINIECISHYAVPDHAEMMMDVLNRASKEAEIVFLTGGLGPTTDDFTRNIVADWLGAELIFDEEIYTDLQAKFKKAGRNMIEGHKQQCFFPQDSQIFNNRAGTAQGFCGQKNDTKIICLPGPPLEIETIWKDSLLSYLETLGAKEQYKLIRYTCFGAGESEVSVKVEEALKDCGYLLGYRASVPYVIVKVWVPIEKWESSKENLSRLEEAIGQWVIKAEPVETFCEKINSRKSVVIIDSETRGELFLRLQPYLKRDNIKVVTNYGEPLNIKDYTDEMVLQLGPKDSSSWKVETLMDGNYQETLVKPPYKLSTKSRRIKKFAVELALFAWLEQL